MLISEPDYIITTPVSDKPNYISKIDILQRPLNLICGYNTRNNMRWIMITDRGNRPILTQTFLKNKKICEFNFNANRIGISFTVTLKPKSKDVVIPEDYDYLNWSKDFDLYFLGRTQEKEEKYKANWRKVYVGE